MLWKGAGQSGQTSEAAEVIKGRSPGERGAQVMEGVRSRRGPGDGVLWYSEVGNKATVLRLELGGGVREWW